MRLRMENLLERILSVQGVEKGLCLLTMETGGHAENAETDTSRETSGDQTMSEGCEMSQKNQVAVINVGANTRHYKGYGKIKSPIFDDGRFEFIPIPTGKLVRGEESIEKIEDWPRYEELRSFYDKRENLVKFLPSRNWSNLRMHNDPEFCTFTYGDYLGNPRASKLQHLKKRGHLFFLAHLWKWKNNNFSDDRGDFFLIGFLEIDDWVDLDKPDGKKLERYERNLHALACHKFHPNSKDFQKMDFKKHRIFRGTENSERFQKAVPFNREIADEVLRDADGRRLKWRGGTELARIGSYTRTVKFIEGPDSSKRIQSLWEHVRKYAGK